MTERQPLAWSYSRARTFQRCAREYFWTYYGAHAGWLGDAPEAARAAYRRKKLTPLAFAVGSAVHNAVAKAIHVARSGQPAWTPEQLESAIRHSLNLAWQTSQNRAAWVRRPARGVMLQEVYDNSPWLPTRLEEVRRSIPRLTSNLARSASYREALVAPFAEVQSVDTLETVALRGVSVPVYSAPDLLLRRGDGGWLIADWKLGAGIDYHGDDFQQRCYALALHDTRGVPAEAIIIRLEHLNSGTADETAATDEDLEATRQRIADSVAAMRRYLSDEAANEPREQAAFPLAAERSGCPACKFYPLCEAELAASPPGPFAA